MSKYRVAIVPSSEDERGYEGIETIRGMQNRQRKLDKEGRISTSLSVHSFDSAKELNAFMQGYEAGVGWMGEGIYLLEEPK